MVEFIDLVNKEGDGGFLIPIYDDRDQDMVNALLKEGYKIRALDCASNLILEYVLWHINKVCHKDGKVNKKDVKYHQKKIEEFFKEKANDYSNSTTDSTATTTDN